MIRIAAQVEYDGSAYRGWQRQQKGVSSVQEEVEKALSKLANEPITVMCAGRTDAGVHALGQVIHFDTNADRRPQDWLLGTNFYLPQAIRIVWAQSVSETFHARYSATGRSYRYEIYNRAVRPAIMANFYTWEKRPLNESFMHEAGQWLLGEQDFSSYRAAGCQSVSPWRNVTGLKVSRHREIVTIDISANAFLHHMVRNIAGVLIAIGIGKKPPIWAKEVLELKDRKAAGVTACPAGLKLLRVSYPEAFGLPL